jgi:hypothetical protein
MRIVVIILKSVKIVPSIALQFAMVVAEIN